MQPTPDTSHRVSFKALGVEVELKAPLTAGDYDLLTGVSGSALEDAIQQTLYHDLATTIRRKVAADVDGDVTISLPRQSKQNDKGKEVYTETEANYITRVREAGHREAVESHIRKHAHENSLLDCLRDWKTSARSRFSKDLMKWADETRARWENGQSSPEKTAASFAQRGVVWDNPSADIGEEEFYVLLKKFDDAGKNVL